MRWRYSPEFCGNKICKMFSCILVFVKGSKYFYYIKRIQTKNYKEEFEFSCKYKK
jgi:hypothetical protein